MANDDTDESDVPTAPIPAEEDQHYSDIAQKRYALKKLKPYLSDEELDRMARES